VRANADFHGNLHTLPICSRRRLAAGNMHYSGATRARKTRSGGLEKNKKIGSTLRNVKIKANKKSL